MKGDANSALTQAPEPLVVALAQKGESAAFTELVTRRQGWIRGWLRRWSQDAALADDLAQQTFVAAWSQLSKLKDPRAFPGWLKTIARNQWLANVRKHDPIRGADAEPGEKGRSATPDIGMDLESALATLPSAMRRCIVLAYRDGCSHGEIAQQLDLPLGTVKSWIARGTKQLKKELAAYKDTSHE